MGSEEEAKRGSVLPPSSSFLFLIFRHAEPRRRRRFRRTFPWDLGIFHRQKKNVRYFAIECRTVPLLWEQRKQENMLSAHVVRFRGQDRCSFPPVLLLHGGSSRHSFISLAIVPPDDRPEDKLQARERATLSPPPTKTLHDLSQRQRLLRSLPPQVG